ncbi:MAG TPA: C2H2-type zinc finger protein, partial [Rhabdochlamydiaceae bacterium]
FSDAWSDSSMIEETPFSTPDLPPEDQFPPNTREVWQHFHSMPTHGDQRAWKQFFARQDALEDPSLLTTVAYPVHELGSPLATGEASVKKTESLFQSKRVQQGIPEALDNSAPVVTSPFMRYQLSSSLAGEASAKKTESLFKAKLVQPGIPDKPEIKVMPKFLHEEIRFKCPIEVCRKIFNRKLDLMNHMASVHREQKELFNTLFKKISKGDKKFPCPQPDCPSGYSHPNDLKRHLKQKHNLVEPTKLLDKPYGCPLPDCSFKYPTKKSLRYHMRKKH